jgi:hypothetical protein
MRGMPRTVALATVLAAASACSPASPSQSASVVPDRTRAAVCIAGNQLAGFPGDLFLFEKDAAASNMPLLEDDLAGLAPAISVIQSALGDIPTWPPVDRVKPMLAAAFNKINGGLSLFRAGMRSNDAAKLEAGVTAIREGLRQLDTATAEFAAMTDREGIVCRT